MRQLIRVFVMCVCAMALATPSWGSSLNSRAAYQVKKIRANMAYLKRQGKFGYKAKARRMFPSLITDKYQALLRTFPDAQGHPAIAKLKADMDRLWSQLSASAAPPARADPRHPTRRHIRRPPRARRPLRRVARRGHRSAGGACQRSVCRALVSKYDHCPYGASSTMSVRSTLRSDVDRFMRKVRDSARSKRALEAFFAKNPSCCQGRVRQMHKRCQQAPAHLQAKWRKYLAFIRKNRSNRVLRYALKMNEHPMLRQDASAIRQRIKANAGAAKRAKAAFAAKVARTACPRQKAAYRNPRLKGAIRSALRRHFHRNLRSGLRERLGRYTLKSRPRRAYNRWNQTLYELVDTWVCVRQTNAKKWGKQARCKAFNVSVRRSRPHGSRRWNRWRYFITRGHFSINCNTYR